MPTTMKPTLIFDMDGTLSRCSEYYIGVQKQFATYKSLQSGLPEALILKLLHDVDLSATSLPDAFKRSRFPRSFMATSFAVDALAEREVSVAEATIAFEIGNRVFDAPYSLYDGVTEVLETLRKDGWHMVLLTKGDSGVQWSKVRKNNLLRFFDTSSIYVTLTKSTELVQQIIADEQIDVAHSYSIGDSLKDDIAPANAAGLNSILLTDPNEAAWAYNKHDVTPSFSITNINQLLGLLPVCQTA